jgi:hypothetical protein
MMVLFAGAAFRDVAAVFALEHLIGGGAQEVVVPPSRARRYRR